MSVNTKQLVISGSTTVGPAYEYYGMGRLGWTDIPGAVDFLDSSSRIFYPSTQESTTDLRLTATDPFSINFWVKAGWDANLDTEGRYIYIISWAGSDTGSNSNNFYNNHIEVYYDERDNRLWFSMSNISASLNVITSNFYFFHNPTTSAVTGHGTNYPTDNWTATNPGNTNDNGFSMLTITYDGSENLVTGFRMYWNGNDAGAPFGTEQNLNGGITNMDTSTPRLFSVLGRSTAAVGSGDEGAGRQGGNTGTTIIDEVSIWNEELSASDITNLWNNGEGGTISRYNQPPNLITYYSFDKPYINTTERLINPVWPNNGLGLLQYSGSSGLTSGSNKIY